MTSFVFELAVASSLQRLGALTQARDKQAPLALNKAGSCSFWLPLKDSMAQQVEEAATCVLIKMFDPPNPPKIIWSGPVWDTTKNRGQKRLEVGCVGWFQTFDKRVTKPTWPALSTLATTAANGPLVYSNDDASDIVFDLVSIANAAEDPGVPIYVTPGVAQATQLRSMTIQPWTGVRGQIESLTELESGFDMLVDPATRKLNTYTKLWTPRPQLLFEYGGNTTNVTTTTNVDKMCNRMIAYSAIGYAIAEDQESIDEFGPFEEAVSLTDIVDITILQAFADAEVAVRSTPLAFHSFEPRESTRARPKDPLIFRDFNIGDIGRLKVTQEGDNINQAARLFGATVNFQNNGAVKLSNVQTSAEAV